MLVEADVAEVCIIFGQRGKGRIDKTEVKDGSKSFFYETFLSMKVKGNRRERPCIKLFSFLVFVIRLWR